MEREGFVFVDKNTAMRRVPPSAPRKGERRVEIHAEDSIVEVTVGVAR